MKNKNESLGSKDPRLLVNIPGMRQPEEAMDEANRDEQAKFEAWAINQHVDIRKCKDYYCATTRLLWITWQAAVARCEPVGEGKARQDLEGIDDAS